MVQKIRGLMSSPATIVKRPLEDLPAIMQSCDVLVGLDSGAVHIAAAVGTPTVVLFGPAEPHEVRPLSKRTAVVIKDGYPCRPCDQVHCVQPENTCMDALTVEVVCEQVGRLLDNRAAVAKTPE
jgi:ADP-heptose:LPS heptosyltransferase